MSFRPFPPASVSVLSLSGLLALWAAVPAAAAAPGIVVQRSVAGVHLRMSSTGVRGVLGKPDRVASVKDPIQGTVRRFDYGRTHVFLSPTADGTVFSIVTTDRKLKTASGVGVGASRKQVLAGVPKVTCEGSAKLGLCTVGTAKPGQRVTQFVLRSGRVTRVALGFVID
jgi:hypothetical protein